MHKPSLLHRPGDYISFTQRDAGEATWHPKSGITKIEMG